MNENKRIDNPRIKIVKCLGAKAQDVPVANLPVVDFLSREKCPYQSHWFRNFRFFFPYKFGFLSPQGKFERLCQ